MNYLNARRREKDPDEVERVSDNEVRNMKNLARAEPLGFDAHSLLSTAVGDVQDRQDRRIMETTLWGMDYLMDLSQSRNNFVQNVCRMPLTDTRGLFHYSGGLKKDLDASSRLFLKAIILSTNLCLSLFFTKSTHTFPLCWNSSSISVILGKLICKEA